MGTIEDITIEDITKNSEKIKLFHSGKSLHRSQFEDSPFGIYYITPEGAILHANPAIIDLLGFSSFKEFKHEIQVVIGLPLLWIPKPYLVQFEMGGVIVGLESKWRKNDVFLYIRQNVRAICEINGAVKYYECIIENITDKKQKEELLEASEIRWRFPINRNQDIIFTISRDGNIFFLNSLPTGLTPNEVLGTSVYDYVNPKYQKSLKQLIEQVFDTGKPIDYDIPERGSSGMISWYSTRFSPVKIKEEVVAVTMITWDITEQKKVLDALKKSEAKYASILKVTNERNRDLARRTYELEILYRLSQQFDYSLDYDEFLSILLPNLDRALPHDVSACLLVFKEKLHLSIRPLRPITDGIERKIQNLLIKAFVKISGNKTIESDKNITISLEENACDPSKPQMTSIESIFQVPIFVGDERELIGLIFVASNQENMFSEDHVRMLYTVANQATITIERHRAERARQELDRNRVNFIAMTSHELRTPLTVIRGYIDLFSQHLDNYDPDQMDTYLDDIGENISRLERLINAVNDVSRIEQDIFELDIKPMEFCRFMRDIKKHNKRSLGTSIEFRDYLNSLTVYIKGDADRLYSVFDNLIENAIKQTPKSGKKIIINTEVFPDIVRVSVSDNGVGITPENMESIFDKFVSIPTKYSVTGSGIGLYISRQIIEGHRGTITAKSEGKDKGALFIVDLPRMKK